MKIRSLVPALGLVAVFAVSALAQVGRLEGQVKKAGSGEFIANAEVQIFRQDIKWSSGIIKTDKKGKFIHAGIQLGGRYTLIVAADGCSPQFMDNLRADQPEIVIEMAPGDGRRLNYDEVKAALANKGKPGGPGGAPGAAAAPAANPGDKKAAEDYKKKVEEVTKKNEKIKADNEAMNNALEAGKGLFNAKNYAGAIAEFDKGIAIDQEQHVFWYFKGLSQFNKGVTELNESIKDPSQRDPAKQDFTDAVANATKAVAVLDASVAADPTKQAAAKPTRVGYLKVKADAASLLGRRFSDQAMAESSNKDYLACAEMSDDPAKKRDFAFKGAETLREAGMTDPAVAAYQAILATDPNFTDCYYGMGIAYAGNEKTFQDAANYLQLFVDKAPNDPRAGEAKQVIDALKVGNNIKPSKEAMKILQKDAGGGAEKGKPAPKKKP